MEKEINKKIYFDKVAHRGNRKSYLPIIEISISYRNKDWIYFSVCGALSYLTPNKWVMGGQCLDELKKLLPNNKLFIVIYDLWKKYHLKDIKKIPYDDMVKILDILGGKEYIYE